jgi:hypothetical protein
MAVEPTARFFCPKFIKFKTSAVDETGTRFASGTLIPFWEQLRISNVCVLKDHKQEQENHLFKMVNRKTIS